MGVPGRETAGQDQWLRASTACWPGHAGTRRAGRTPWTVCGPRRTPGVWNISTACSNPRPASAAAVDPFRLPEVARDLTGRACADLDERACWVWLDGGWLAEAALAVAFGGPRPNAALYGLFEETLAGVPGRVEALARQHALDPGRMPDWRLFAGLSLEEDGGGGVDLVLACESV